jgi:hypothetical protein
MNSLFRSSVPVEYSREVYSLREVISRLISWEHANIIAFTFLLAATVCGFVSGLGAVKPTEKVPLLFMAACFGIAGFLFFVWRARHIIKIRKDIDPHA